MLLAYIERGGKEWGARVKKVVSDEEISYLKDRFNDGLGSQSEWDVVNQFIF